MKKLLWLSSLLLCCLLTMQAQNKSSKEIDVKVQVTYAEHLGKTPQIRHLAPMPPTDAEKRKLAKMNKKAPRNFIGRGKNTVVRPELEHLGADKLRQIGFEKDGGGIEIEPLINIDGITSGTAPNDPTGDIGKDHYLQAVNVTTIGVFTKEGILMTTFNANTLWGSLGFSSAGDPIILYDQEVDRWIMTEFPNPNQLLVAISETSDPLGSWDAYNFATPSFPDYPKYGIWGNAYTVTTNEGGPGNLSCYMINRAEMLAGAATVTIQRLELPGNNNTEAGFFVATPVDWSGLNVPVSDPTFLALNDASWGATPEDAVEIYSVDVDWDNAANTVVTNTTVVLSPYDGYPCSVGGYGFACVPQGGGGGGLDAIPEVIMNQPHYRNFGSHEAMVFSFVTDVTAGDNLSGIRWVELRKTIDTDWTLYQEGTFAPQDGLDRYMCSIAMDGSGNIGLAYNVSSENEFVGVRFTGRRASDPLGEMTVIEYNAVTGENTINSFGRFGDYAHMSIDPTNDRTFWYTTEYAGGGGVNTRIIAFELKKDTIDIGPSAIISPTSAGDLSDTETLQIEVTNFGIETQTEFQVGFIFEDGTEVVEDVSFVLESEATYMHTFTPTVDMSAVKDYSFKVFTVLGTDQAVLNDTLHQIISKLPQWDAGVTDIIGLDSEDCVDSLFPEVVLTNFGTETLTEVTISLFFNGAFLFDFPWTGSLASGASENVVISLTDLVTGENELTASTLNPNGEMDQGADNDSYAATFNAITEGTAVFLELTTDFYAGETTWEVTDNTGNLIASGGPYQPYADSNTTFFFEWCLALDACYTFTIFDEYGDGICCEYGDGSYTITDGVGNVLLSGGEFGYEDSGEFCVGVVCLLDADIDIAPESSSGTGDGAIMVTAENGAAPYQYSIDGGTTFQASSVFTDLSAGEYQITVVDANDCSYEESVELSACTLSVMVEVTNASGEAISDGQLEVTVTDGAGAYQYSIDGGMTFQSSNVFTGLAVGSYNVIIEDGIGCTVIEQFGIDFSTGIEGTIVGQSIEVFPNPTDGIFRINLTGVEHSSVFLGFEIFNTAGQRIQVGNLVKYDNTYTSMVSLVHYPSGVYFVRLLHDDVARLIKVVRK